MSTLIRALSQLNCENWTWKILCIQIVEFPSSCQRRQMRSKKSLYKKLNAGFNHLQLSWLMSKYKLECRVRHSISEQSPCKWIGHHEKVKCHYSPTGMFTCWLGEDGLDSQPICLPAFPSGDGSLSHTVIMSPCKWNAPFLSSVLLSIHRRTAGKWEQARRVKTTKCWL